MEMKFSGEEVVTRILFGAPGNWFERHPKLTIAILFVIYAVIDYLGDFQP